MIEWDFESCVCNGVWWVCIESFWCVGVWLCDEVCWFGVFERNDEEVGVERWWVLEFGVCFGIVVK